MSRSTIALPVDDEAGRAYANASPEEKQKIQLLLRLRLRDLTTPAVRAVRQVMDDISTKAEARGLTPETLALLLRER